MIEPATAAEAVKTGWWIARVCQKLGWHPLKSTMHKMQLDLLRPLHLGFHHAARILACQMFQEWDKDHKAASLLAVDVATACRDSMEKLLQLKPSELHCCLKLMAPSINGRARVGTWARSKPPDGRPQELEDENAHFADQNTVWSSLMSLNDGATGWEAEYTCFSCNNLAQHGGRFKCDRNNWASFYQSALVFPLRYAKEIDGTKMGNVGFVAFDSQKINAFPDLPDIFDFIGRPAYYLGRLHACPAFHLGASFADTLGTFLGAAYESSLTRNGVPHETK